MTDLFEALMTAAERADGFLQRSGAKVGLLALLAAVLLIYAFVPAPYEPEMPCPMDNTLSIGLAPPLWWVGGGPRTPVLSSIGLDANSRIRYDVMLGASDEDMEVVGTVHGGRGKENLHLNITTPLEPGTVYRWQVRAENRLKKNSESEAWTFSTRALPEIELFQADRSMMDLGESVALRWTVINAKDAEIEPGVGEVSLRGEASLEPQDDVTYTLTARNFAGEVWASVDVVVFQPHLIDSMAGGWSTYEDGKGSLVQDIRSVAGVEENATRISYDLIPGGWVGITKTLSRRGANGNLNLAGTDGLSFICKGSGSTNALEIWVRDANGTIFGRSWDEGAISQDWACQEAGYEEFDCIEVEETGCKDASFDFGNITAIYFVVADRENQEFGSSGWITIGDLEALHQQDGEAES